MNDVKIDENTLEIIYMKLYEDLIMYIDANHNGVE